MKRRLSNLSTRVSRIKWDQFNLLESARKNRDKKIVDNVQKYELDEPNGIISKILNRK